MEKKIMKIMENIKEMKKNQAPVLATHQSSCMITLVKGQLNYSSESELHQSLPFLQSHKIQVGCTRIKRKRSIRKSKAVST